MFSYFRRLRKPCARQGRRARGRPERPHRDGPEVLVAQGTPVNPAVACPMVAPWSAGRDRSSAVAYTDARASFFWHELSAHDAPVISVDDGGSSGTHTRIHPPSCLYSLSACIPIACSSEHPADIWVACLSSACAALSANRAGCPHHPPHRRPRCPLQRADILDPCSPRVRNAPIPRPLPKALNTSGLD